MSRRTSLSFAALTLLAAAGGLSSQPPRASPLHVSFDGGRSTLAVKRGSFSGGPFGPFGGDAIAAGDKGPLLLEGTRSLAVAFRVTAFVRLRPETAGSARADFLFGRGKESNSGLRMAISAAKGGDAATCTVTRDGKPLVDPRELAKGLDWVPETGGSFTFHPRAYPFKDIRPGWPEDFRARIEADMAALPDVADKWLAVRIEATPSEVRFWLDDRLVARKADEGLPGPGTMEVHLSPGAQLAAYAVSPWGPSPAFEPVRLDAYNNGKAFVGNRPGKPDSLPRDGPLVVGGVPFAPTGLNPEGNDHIDVGRSLYRQANQEGYLQSFGPRWAGSALRDPARIQVRIPNGAYDTLYLLAAADGRPNHVPLVTATFYRPGAGFAESFEATVPPATAEGHAERVAVALANGKPASLWLVKVPLDPGRLSSFGDLDIVEVELTKKVLQYRSYPDPIIYGFHQGGPPSSVRVYGMTLGKAPVEFAFDPDRFGHVWTTPAVPGYAATLTNRSDADREGTLRVVTRSYDGTETTTQERAIGVRKNGTAKVSLAVPVRLNGHHDITATLSLAERHWTEKRSFVRLAPDARAERWSDGQGALFGYWSYHGGHHTPKAEHHVALMTAAGARASIGIPQGKNELIERHWARTGAGAWEVAPQAWAAEEPYDPAKYVAYQKEVVEKLKKARDALPPQFRPDHVYLFPEPHVSQRLTEGNYPEYWNGEPLVYTDEEEKRLRMFLVTARCAAEAVRKEFPELKVLIPWGDPLFAVPLLRAGFPKELVDGSGLDVPGFERLPEMQLHQNGIHRLYELRKEFEKAGIPKPRLQYAEGVFVPTEPGAVSYREQMDLYTRWTLLSMAYGVDRFYSGWFAFDCGNYYGSEHYGGCGIQRRIPYCDPKPAYAGFATMTARLDRANFDGWVKTGSTSTFCLRFKGPKGPVYALWTLRGRRPVALTLAADGDASATDSMNNTRVLKARNRTVTLDTDASVSYVEGAEVAAAAVGEPDHADAAPPAAAKPVADLGDGSWAFGGERDKPYENGTFAVSRYPGKFRGEIVADARHGKVLRSTLEKQGVVRELMPWYASLVPKKPVALPGVPAALGLWVKGASDWGRVVYVLKDGKGERWTSIGTQDQYNCDDPHSWSAFNFDGWRCLRFELPGHAGYDSFRKHGTTWWRSDGGDGVVDLPLTLERVIVEQRSHVLYVNDVQPAPSASVEFGKLYVEYAGPDDAAPAAVAASRLRMPHPPAAANLPNPIARASTEGVLEATALTKLEPPLDRNDGTAFHVHYKEVAGAKHHVWVGTRPDGRGAVDLTPAGAVDGVLLRDLRPGVKFYVWATHADAQGKASKPSPPMEIVLKDSFGEK